MDILEAVKTRRAIKSFDKKASMSDEDKQKFMDLARLAPSAYNLQHCRFVVVDDNNMKLKMQDIAHGQSQIADAPLVIVMCADLKVWYEDNIAACWPEASQAMKESFFPMIRADYCDNLQMERDEAMRSIGIAAGQMMITARAMGYDTCPMVGFDFDKMAELISLPEDHIIGMVLAVGKRGREPRSKQYRLPQEAVIIKNQFERS